MKIYASFVAVMLFSSWAYSSHVSGRISRGSQGEDSGCAITIAGDFELGTDEMLIREINRAGADFRRPVGWDPNPARTVCLNSHGGNFNVGLKIARILMTEGIGTVVMPGHQCYSTCAFVFMFGTARVKNLLDNEVDSESFRTLHWNGSLGFHSPFLDDQSTLSEADFSERYQSYGIMKSEFEKYFPSLLLQRVLTFTPDSLYRIQYARQAQQFGIQLFPGSDLPEDQICENRCLTTRPLEF